MGSSGHEVKVRLTVKGAKEDSDLRVVEVKGEEGVSMQFLFNLLLASDDANLSLDEMVGSSAWLTISTSEGDRYVHGMISRLQQRDTDSGRHHTFYQATLVPRAWRLRLRKDCRIFQNMNAKEIIASILKEEGITHKFHGKDTIPKRVYCVQFRESDWAFISRLLEEDGYFYYFEHKLKEEKTDQNPGEGLDKATPEHILHIGNNFQHHKDIPGENRIPFHGASGGVAGQEHIYRFFYGQAVRSGKVTLDDYNYEKPALDLTSASAGEKNKKLEVYEYPGDYQTKEEGKRQAELRWEAIEATRKQGEGQSTCPRLVAGHYFMLDKYARKELNGKRFLLTRIHHTAEPAPDDEGLSVGQLQRDTTYYNDFHCIPRKVPFRPLRRTPRPRIIGVQTAIVQAVSGEIDSQLLGEVHVKFHWDRRKDRPEVSGKQLTCRIRVAQYWAGPAYGAMYIPRKDHEVIVEFIDGDPDRPIITGRVYNGLNVPPYPLPQDQTISTIMSHSSPEGSGFNEIRFEDKKGKEEFFTHAERTQNEIVKASQHTSVGGGRYLTVGKDHVEQVDGESTHKVAGDRTVKTEADYQLDAGASIKEKAKSNVTLKASGGYLLAQAGGPAALVGAKAMVSGEKGGVSINGKPNVDIKGAATVTVDGAGAVDILGGDVHIDGGNIHLKGTNIFLDGNVFIKGGLVDIVGSPLLLNCGGVGAQGGMGAIISGPPGGEDPGDGLAGVGAKDRAGRSKKPGGGEQPGGEKPTTAGGKKPTTPGGEKPTTPGGERPRKETASLLVWVGWHNTPQGPVHGATVTLSGPTKKTGTTNKSGFIQFDNLQAGDYIINAMGTRSDGSSMGKGSDSKTLSVGKLTKTAITLREVPSKAGRAVIKVSVTLRFPDGTTQPGVGVIISLQGPTPGQKTTTSGSETFSRCAPGSYTVVGSLTDQWGNLLSDSKKVTVADGETANAALVLTVTKMPTKTVVTKEVYMRYERHESMGLRGPQEKPYVLRYDWVVLKTSTGETAPEHTIAGIKVSDSGMLRVQYQTTIDPTDFGAHANVEYRTCEYSYTPPAVPPPPASMGVNLPPTGQGVRAQYAMGTKKKPPSAV